MATTQLHRGEIDLNVLERLNPEQRKKALEAIRTLEGTRSRNPLFYYNHPVLSEKPVHIKQMMFHAMPARLRIFAGGNQSGKTTAGLVDDVAQCIDWEALPHHLHYLKRYEGAVHGRILTTSLDTLEMVVNQKLRELIPKEQLIGDSFDKAYHNQRRILRFKNGSTIQGMTYKQDREDMGGRTLHFVHYDEEPPEWVWGENRVRVVRLGGHEIITFTPLEGLTWMYDKIWQPLAEDTDQYQIEGENDIWEAEDFTIGDMDMPISVGAVQVDMDDNPYLSEEDKAYVLAGYSETEKKARKSGQFVAMSGLIYAEFDVNLHVKRTPDIESMISFLQGTNVVVAIDPGWRYRCGVLWAALNADNILFPFEEIYARRTVIKDIADEIFRINAYYEIDPVSYLIDPSARRKNQQTGKSDQDEFSDAGIWTIPANNAFRAGVNNVATRLQYSKLFIFDNCVNLVNEMKKHRWKEEPRSGEETREEPLRKDNHLADTLRYICMSRPYLPRPEEVLRESPLERKLRLHQEQAGTARSSGPYGGGMYK